MTEPTSTQGPPAASSEPGGQAAQDQMGQGQAGLAGQADQTGQEQAGPAGLAAPAGQEAHRKKPLFNYDLEVFELCVKFLEEKNHHGLALIARQRGLPPFLRFKIWPILLKYHPFVVKPLIQPDNNESSEGKTKELAARVKKDLNKYLIRLKYSKLDLVDDEETVIENQIFEILEGCVLKFMSKWGKIIKYDSSLTWIALALAEWYPPIAHTKWVLVGRDLSSQNNNSIKDLMTDYSIYIDNIPNLQAKLDEIVQDETISNMSFHDAYERLVLVLLHCPANKLKKSSSLKPQKLNTEKLMSLPRNGGSIEERVTSFVYLFKKLLPELASYFSEEQILNKFGSNDDEWLIWWLKYCGSKVWSRLDRGRIWDLVLGFKLKNPQKDYSQVLQLDHSMLTKLGNNDHFWCLNFENLTLESQDSTPFPQIDPHMQLIFIALALLKSKENVLIELDQHEIRQYLSRLPTNSYNITNKYQLFKQKIDKKREEESSRSSLAESPATSRSSTADAPDSPDAKGHIISNDSNDSHTIDFMDSIINEAGELWRKWLWVEHGDSESHELS